jgi:hypothetical protein
LETISKSYLGFGLQPPGGAAEDKKAPADEDDAYGLRTVLFLQNKLLFFCISLGKVGQREIHAALAGQI